MHLVHTSKNGNVIQIDSENCFVLNYKGNEYKLGVCAFIALKSKIDRIDMVKLLLDDSSTNNLEIISLCNNSRLLVLTLDEILELKELLTGSLVMLELNSILHQRINRVLA